MRLIDADALNKALNDHVDAINENRRKGATLPNIAWFSGMACAESIVEAQPTVDAVPVIRCKDCKYRDPEDHKCDCGHDIRWQLPREDNWFCADAERKEE